MHNLTKTLLTSMALTLGACDADSIADDFGDGATAFRPGAGGFSLNTSFIGGHDYAELDLKGNTHRFAKLAKVCLGKQEVCIYPSKDKLWVEKGQILGQKGLMSYKGADFINSRWYLTLDHDRDGVMDSTIQLLILDAQPNATVQTGIDYWDYYWAYDSKSAAGLVTKYIEQGEAPIPTCEPDAETGSLGSIILGDSSLDTSPTTKGVVEVVPDSMFVACHSGASGKAPTWGYVLHDLGHEAYTNALRVIRADYCNQGQSFTEAGQKLAVTDDRVISDQYDAGYKLEGLASFEKGWMCIFQPRMVDLVDVTNTCDIKICDETAILGDMGSDIMTQLVY